MLITFAAERMTNNETGPVQRDRLLQQSARGMMGTRALWRTTSTITITLRSAVS